MSGNVIETDVLILGAGMAGLTAARALAERGRRVVVLEARDRVGGRVLSLQADGTTVELGAEFIHGRAPELWALIDEAGVETTERDGSMLRARVEGLGGVVEDDSREGSFDALEELESYTGPDVPFSDWLETSDVAQEDRAALIGYVEGFNAADATRIGIRGLGEQQKAEDATEGDRAWHVQGGYAQLADYLAKKIRELGGEIVLNAEVKEIEWQPQSVHIVTTSGAEFHAEQCVIALPLPVVQRINFAGIEMFPEPRAIDESRRIAMGHVARFTMIFRRAWWLDSTGGASADALREMSFLFTPQDVPSVWWTPHPEPGPAMLTAWVGGPRSAKLAGSSTEDQAEIGCAVLAKAFGVAVEDVRAELVSTHTHDWSGDPYALGAYSYIPSGAINAPRAMTEPESDTLFFAGEHTDITGHWGTVHAAMRSGLRAAEQVMGDTAG